MRNEWIWLDMDGTIADLYGVEGWLNDLINYQTRPYEIAETLYMITDLIIALQALKEKGYHIGIVSWGSKNSNKDFLNKVEKAKQEWIIKHSLDHLLDKIIVAPYGTRKADLCRAYGAGILVDDEQKNRDEWDLGITIDATKNIINEFWELI